MPGMFVTTDVQLFSDIYLFILVIVYSVDCQLSIRVPFMRVCDDVVTTVHNHRSHCAGKQCIRANNDMYFLDTAVFRVL